MCDGMYRAGAAATAGCVACSGRSPGTRSVNHGQSDGRKERDMYAQHQHQGPDGGMHGPGGNFGGGQSMGGGGAGQFRQQGGTYGSGPWEGQSGRMGSPMNGPMMGQSGSQRGGQIMGGQMGGQMGNPSMGSWGGTGGASGSGWQPASFQGERRMGQHGDVAFNERTLDKDYNLVSVLYHALQGVETAHRYCQDAQREGSPEVAQFLEQVAQQQQQIAQRAKELLFRQRQV